MTVVRVQRQRTKGWRMPEGAVYVGRPTIFGNPWGIEDAIVRDIPPSERQAWCVAKYRSELEHLGLMSDWGGLVSEERWEEMSNLLDTLPSEVGPDGIGSIRPLFRYLLRDATALVCWCPLVDADGRPVPCHADVLIELLGEP